MHAPAAADARPPLAAHTACACGGICPRCSPRGESAVHHVLSDRGQSLPVSASGPLSRHFGADLSSVRLHTGPAAAAATNEVGARRAFATGNHVVIGQPGFTPGTSEGLKLLAHEVTHVLQQQGASAASAWAADAPHLEREARRAADSISDEPFRPIPSVRRATAARGQVQCDEPIELSAGASTALNFDPNAIVDVQGASLLDEVLRQSQFLKPYIQDKLSDKHIAEAGKFIIHTSDPEFDMAYMTLNQKLDEVNNPAFREYLARVKGFYLQSDDSIHLRPQADMANALHESIHKFSNPGFRSMFDDFVDEGTTQYFADKVHVELGLPPAGSHAYGEQVAFATKLVSYLGESFTAERFFGDFNAPAILDKLGLSLQDYNKKYRFGDDAKERFFRYLKKRV